MLFDFATAQSPLSDSLVLSYNPGAKRIGWMPPAPRLGPILPSRGRAPRSPKRDQ